MNKNLNINNHTIYVDLDNTLIKTDMLHESVISLIKANIIYIFFIPLWLLKGKAFLKDQIASRVNPRYDLLPYNTELIDYLKKEKEQGRKLVLATASNKKFASGINEHLKLFDECIASDRKSNIKSHEKLKAILEAEQNRPFDYAGDSTADHSIFEKANSIILVNPDKQSQMF